MATASSPLGPFKQVEQKTLLDKNAIDGSFFEDDDGRWYLYFSMYAESGPHTQTIYGAELADDMLSLKTETVTKLAEVDPDAAWENVQAIIHEGPFMLKHEGTYYLSYSANVYTSHSYAVGYAVSSEPLGTFEKYSENPILSRSNAVYGTGHHCFVYSPDGTELFIVYHIHFSETSVHARYTCIDRAFFVENPDSGPDVLCVFGPTTTPQPLPSGSMCYD